MDPNADLHTTGCIDYYLHTIDERVLCIYSSVNMAMKTVLEQTDGYSEGQLLSDFTYKICKEKLPFFVLSVVDIAQHGHTVAFGPSSHEDSDNVCKATHFLNVFVTTTLKGIHTGTFPGMWAENLCKNILDTYKNVVPTDFITLTTKTSLTDCASALPNGMARAIPTINKSLDCWAHVWRFVLKSCLKVMKDSTKERVDMLFTDISFVHEIPLIFNLPIADLLKPNCIRLIDEKWMAIGESDLVDYLRKNVLWRKFSRCDSVPGKPTDTNTHEAMNRVLKSENHFNSVEGMGTVMVRSTQTGRRLSRDQRPFATVPVVSGKIWKRAQVLFNRGWQNLAYSFGDRIIVPSEKLMDAIPEDLKTIGDKRTHISKWAKEFTAIMRNPGGYYKMQPGSADSVWDVSTPPLPSHVPLMSNTSTTSCLFSHSPLHLDSV